MMIRLTATQLAARLGVSERTVQRHINDGHIHAREIKRGLYEIEESDLERLAAERDPHSSEIARLAEELEAVKRDLVAQRAELETLKSEMAELRLAASPSPEYQAPVSESRRAAPFMDVSGRTVSAGDFAEKHRVNPRTMRDYIGGKRFNGDRIEAVVIGRAGAHTIHGLTRQQQYEAILFFGRNGVFYTPCPDCPHEK